MSLFRVLSEPRQGLAPYLVLFAIGYEHLVMTDIIHYDSSRASTPQVTT